MTTWLEHVKSVHKSGNTSFKESLKRASASWKKRKAAPARKKAAKKGKKKCAECEEKVSTGTQASGKKKRKKKSMPKLPLKNIENVSL